MFRNPAEVMPVTLKVTPALLKLRLVVAGVAPPRPVARMHGLVRQANTLLAV